jgi:hypothetical protein
MTSDAINSELKHKESKSSPKLDAELLGVNSDEGISVCEHVTVTTGRNNPDGLTTSTPEIFTTSKIPSNAQFYKTSQAENASPPECTPLHPLQSTSPTPEASSLSFLQPVTIINTVETPQHLTTAQQLPRTVEPPSVDQKSAVAPATVVPKSLKAAVSLIKSPTSSSPLTMPRVSTKSTTISGASSQFAPGRKSRYEEPRRLTRWDGKYSLENSLQSSPSSFLPLLLLLSILHSLPFPQNFLSNGKATGFFLL